MTGPGEPAPSGSTEPKADPGVLAEQQRAPEPVETYEITHRDAPVTITITVNGAGVTKGETPPGSADAKPDSKGSVLGALRDIVLVAAVFIYLFGFSYLHELHDALGVPPSALSSFGLYEILVYGQLLFTTPDILMRLAALFIGAALLVTVLPIGLERAGVKEQRWASGLSYVVVIGAALLLLAWVPAWAFREADARAEQMQTRDVLRVKFAIKPGARSHYDSRFHHCNDAFRLRLITDSATAVYALATVSDCRGSASVVTYKVRTADFDSLKTK